MEYIIEKSSSIVVAKSKFFIFRAVTYFAFLLIPVWIQKTIDTTIAAQCALMSFYMAFMVAQWFLLGKEIDHRLKIYFKVNSALDRIVYRLFLGMMSMVLYFNILIMLPQSLIGHFFWGTWVVLGLFYSWPTRGKIIQETVTTHFGEFGHLDSFEKTLLIITLIMFVFSIPMLPKYESVDALKVHLDPFGTISKQFWNFLYVNYYPFKKFGHLFALSWSLHFYIIVMGSYLITFYALLRYIVSRRLALLGIFALLSSWAYSKLLYASLGNALPSTFSVLWIWTLLWVTKSGTYRAGLFLGLIGAWGTIIELSYSVLLIFQFIIMYFFLLKDKTFWFKRQLMKYALFGAIITIIIVATNTVTWGHSIVLNSTLWQEIYYQIGRKAFFSLSMIGLILLGIIVQHKKISTFYAIHFDRQRVLIIVTSILFLLVFSFFRDTYILSAFGVMWPVTLLALLPIEVMFQSISRLRSSRNMIYFIYILICLLDSHFEGRVKIFLKLF